MPQAYARDLHELVEEGHSRRGAAPHFKVSVSSMVNLAKAFDTRGSLEPKPNGGCRHAKLEPHPALRQEQTEIFHRV
jgi:transposase